MLIKSVDNSRYPELEVGREYETERVIIGGFHTEVFLMGYDFPFSSVCFDYKFRKELNKAIEYFNKHYEDYDDRYYGIFERDF